ncbi:hypothetical protein SAMN05216548_11953, partial [Faunimonas pinastri]
MRDTLDSVAATRPSEKPEAACSVPTEADAKKPLLVCLSHLRWDFVYQRPQHLLVRAARGFSVVFMEEPVFADEPAPRLDV